MIDIHAKGFWQTIFFVLSKIKKLETALLKRSIFSFILIFLGMLINVFTPVLLRILIRTFESTQDLTTNSFIIVLLFSYGVIWTSGQVIKQLRELLIVKVCCKVIHIISYEVMAHLLDLSMRFHAFKQTGTAVGVIKQAQHAIPRIFWGFLFNIFPVCIEVILASLLITAYYGIIYGSIILALFVIYFIFTLYASHIIQKKARVYDSARQVELGKIADVLFNIETVKYFGSKSFELEKCDDVLQIRDLAEDDYVYTIEKTHLIQGLIIGIGMIATILVSGINVIRGSILVSDFVMINGYILQFVTPFMALSKHIGEARQGVADLQGILQILDQTPEIKEPVNGLIVQQDKELEITFKNISFGYFKEVPILKDVSFSILPGKMTAIVGATGVGKSTITKMLFRFYDPLDGDIFVNGENIKKFSLDSLCNTFGVVPQGASMFNETLLYNLTYGYKDASEEELWNALKIAQLDKFVKNLPHGFETKVGESGIRLSGGERQRLAIARAILKKPKLFIFDEATSALDTATEKSIQKSLHNIIEENITTLVIAHRLTTIIKADQIIVLENGEVVEVGTHEKLLQKSGSYAKLWNGQFEDSSIDRAEVIES